MDVLETETKVPYLLTESSLVSSTMTTASAPGGMGAPVLILTTSPDSRKKQCCRSGSGAFLTPGSGMGKKSGFGSGIRDDQPGSFFLELGNHFFGLKYLNSLMRIRDPGWKQFGSGMEKSQVRDPG
jgi:hypothetical protein